MDGVFKIISGILHIGNVSFKAESGGEGSSIVNGATVGIVASLLSIDERALTEAFVNRSLVTRGEVTKIPLKAEQVK